MDFFKKVNIYLANLTVMYKKVHNLHWNVQGRIFFGLHLKYDELYREFQDKIDEVAERLLSLGHTPVSSYREVLAIATIQERESKPVECEESVRIFLEDLEDLIEDSYDLTELCDDQDDPAGADLFTGYIADFEKHRWMFRALLGENAADTELDDDDEQAEKDAQGGSNASQTKSSAKSDGNGKSKK